MNYKQFLFNILVIGSFALTGSGSFAMDQAPMAKPVVMPAGSEKPKAPIQPAVSGAPVTAPVAAPSVSLALVSPAEKSMPAQPKVKQQLKRDQDQVGLKSALKRSSHQGQADTKADFEDRAAPSPQRSERYPRDAHDRVAFEDGGYSRLSSREPSYNGSRLAEQQMQMQGRFPMQAGYDMSQFGPMPRDPRFLGSESIVTIQSPGKKNMDFDALLKQLKHDISEYNKIEKIFKPAENLQKEKLLAAIDSYSERIRFLYQDYINQSRTKGQHADDIQLLKRLAEEMQLKTLRALEHYDRKYFYDIFGNFQETVDFVDKHTGTKSPKDGWGTWLSKKYTNWKQQDGSLLGKFENKWTANKENIRFYTNGVIDIFIVMAIIKHMNFKLPDAISSTKYVASFLEKVAKLPKLPEFMQKLVYNCYTKFGATALTSAFVSYAMNKKGYPVNKGVFDTIYLLGKLASASSDVRDAVLG